MVCPADISCTEDLPGLARLLASASISVGNNIRRGAGPGRICSMRRTVGALAALQNWLAVMAIPMRQPGSVTSSNPWKINSEIGDLSEDYLGQRQGLVKPLLRFRRYDAPLEAGWLKDQLMRDFSAVELEALRDFTNPSNVDRLYELGGEAAKKQIRADHLPDHFKVEAGAS